MPVYSMTGYASAQRSGMPAVAGVDAKPGAAARLGLEIRSVNSRFLDLSFRLSEELRQHEPALRELVAGRLKRGKVEVRGAVESAGFENLREPSPRLLQRLNSVQDQVRSWLPDARPLSVADVVRLADSDSGAGADWSEALPRLAAA
ncbi:MAG TPA: YicC/YloC family endoribonuclease, partial [Ramlibacter sp.]|nr:YicC/YloC family endoribonuclease [Ramlibacter sp.]